MPASRLISEEDTKVECVLRVRLRPRERRKAAIGAFILGSRCDFMVVIAIVGAALQ